VLWKDVSVIGKKGEEFIVEVSKNKTKFFIVAFNPKNEEYKVIEMFKL
jgi:hypothetical protein